MSKNTLFTAFALFIFNVCGFSSTSVYHFNNTTTLWDEEMIQNLDKISDIVTAGKYAWALDKDLGRVAFYDGTRWNEGVKIPNIDNIYDFAPAYPFSGQMPFVWLRGYNHLAFFDGISWESQHVIGRIEHLYANAGRAWRKIAYNQEIEETDDNWPTHWTRFPSKPHNIDNAFIEIHLGSPEAKELYVKSKSNDYSGGRDYNYVLFKLTKDYTWQPLKEHIPEWYGVSSAGNSVLIGEGGNCEFSQDAGLTWAAPPTSTFNIDLPPRATIDKNIFCANIYAVGAYSGTYVCYDINEPNRGWQQFEINQQNDYVKRTAILHHQILWVMFHSNGTKNDKTPSVFKIDLTTRQILDTHLAPLTQMGNLNDWDIRVLEQNNAITCGVSNEGKISGFYFDGSHWQITPIKNTTQQCQLSHQGADKSFEPLLPNDSVWMFLKQKT